MNHKNDTPKMWSYKLVHDTLFAPNPLWGVLTLATCKPMIRRSPNSNKGTWIAGWTACTIHNPEVCGGGIERCRPGEEKLVYLAQIDEQIPLDEYWLRFPEKRNNPKVPHSYAIYSGDNIYHKDHVEQDSIVAEPNDCGHTSVEDGKRDYHYGKNALICRKFYYFTPDNRVNIDPRFRALVHSAKGQSLKRGKLVEEFIDYIKKIAQEHNVGNGIVGELPVIYRDESQPGSMDDGEALAGYETRKRKGCGR